MSYLTRLLYLYKYLNCGINDIIINIHTENLVPKSIINEPFILKLG